MGKRTLLWSLEVYRRLNGTGLNLLLARFAPSPCVLPLASAPNACRANHLPLPSPIFDWLLYCYAHRSTPTLRRMLSKPSRLLIFARLGLCLIGRLIVSCVIPFASCGTLTPGPDSSMVLVACHLFTCFSCYAACPRRGGLQFGARYCNIAVYID